MKIRVNEHQLERVLIKLQDQRITNRINETKEEVLEKLAIDWLNKRYGKLKIVLVPASSPSAAKKGLKMSLYVNSNNEIIMAYTSPSDPLLIDHDSIWKKMDLLFHLNTNDIQSILKVWVKETYDLEGTEPVPCPSEVIGYLWDEIDDDFDLSKVDFTGFGGEWKGMTNID